MPYIRGAYDLPKVGRLRKDAQHLRPPRVGAQGKYHHDERMLCVRPGWGAQGKYHDVALSKATGRVIVSWIDLAVQDSN